MSKKVITLYYISVGLSALAILNVIVFGSSIIAAPDIIQVQYMSDDAYYYLMLSKNFPVTGVWTFDTGHSVTSGFHPLLAYLLSLTYVVFHPTCGEFVRYGLALSLVTTLISSSFAWLWGLKLRNAHYMLFLALAISLKNFAHNSISIVEWPLVILFSSLYCVYFYQNYDSNRAYTALILFALGLAGSLSRSDFGLLPFSLFITSFIFRYFGQNKKAELISFFGLLGAAVGIFMIFLHNYIFTGEFLQSSARMKAYWMRIYGSIDHSLVAASSLLLAILFGALLLVFIYAMRRKRDHALKFKEAVRELTMLIAASLCVMGYTLLYRSDEVTQPWYTANLIVPSFIVLFIVSSSIKNLLGNDFITLVLSIVIVPTVVTNMTGLYPVRTINAPWPHQQIMLNAGKYLSQQELDGLVGSWNAGIIGYYQGGSIINLDGLVNDDIYEYAIRNDLPTYLSQANINYIIDFENMLSEDLRLRGGYDDANFLSSLRPIKVFDNGEYHWNHLTLYRIER